MNKIRKYAKELKEVGYNIVERRDIIENSSEKTIDYLIDSAKESNLSQNIVTNTLVLMGALIVADAFGTSYTSNHGIQNLLCAGISYSYATYKGCSIAINLNDFLKLSGKQFWD